MLWKGFHYHFLAETKQYIRAVHLQLTSDLDPGLVKWRRRASYATNYHTREKVMMAAKATIHKARPCKHFKRGAEELLYFADKRY